MAAFLNHFWVSVSFWIVTIAQPRAALTSGLAVGISALIRDQRAGQAPPGASAAHTSLSTTPSVLGPANVLAQAGPRCRPTSECPGWTPGQPEHLHNVLLADRELKALRLAPASGGGPSVLGV